MPFFLKHCLLGLCDSTFPSSLCCLCGCGFLVSFADLGLPFCLTSKYGRATGTSDLLPSPSLCSPAVISFSPMTLHLYIERLPSSCSALTSPEFQSHVTNCLLGTYTLISERYLKHNMTQTIWFPCPTLLLTLSSAFWCCFHPLLKQKPRSQIDLFSSPA